MFNSAYSRSWLAVMSLSQGCALFFFSRLFLGLFGLFFRSSSLCGPLLLRLVFVFFLLWRRVRHRFFLTYVCRQTPLPWRRFRRGGGSWTSSTTSASHCSSSDGGTAGRFCLKLLPRSAEVARRRPVAGGSLTVG